MQEKPKIVIGSSNQGKIKEIQKIFSDYEIVSYADVLRSLDIQENGATFEENALLKARCFYDALKDTSDNLVVMSDDSGLCVDALGGEPGIYSARYANVAKGIFENASDCANIECLIQSLHKKSLQSSQAIFVAAIALVGNIGGKSIEKVVRGELVGRVIDRPRGQNGFGYDPLFVPSGYEKTLGELEDFQKNQISHRKNALECARAFLEETRHF